MRQVSLAGPGVLCGNPHVMILRLPRRVGLHVVRVVEHNPPLLQRANVFLVGMLVESQQHVRLVARAQHLSGTNVHLEN